MRNRTALARLRTTCEKIKRSVVAQEETVSRSWEKDLPLFTGRDVNRCPRCGGLIERRVVAATPMRGPPATRELGA